MSEASSSSSVGDLLRGLMTDVTLLLRQEVRRLRAHTEQIFELEMVKVKRVRTHVEFARPLNCPFAGDSNLLEYPRLLPGREHSPANKLRQVDDAALGTDAVDQIADGAAADGRQRRQNIARALRIETPR